MTANNVMYCTSASINKTGRTGSTDCDPHKPNRQLLLPIPLLEDLVGQDRC